MGPWNSVPERPLAADEIHQCLEGQEMAGGEVSVEQVTKKRRAMQALPTLLPWAFH